ncbi:DUF397 domain-containing protein [Kineosporia sp. J2-2]|uniref:DUF397 domain-containing protein n=1 Tax=Kineosporia corallincola TaxID=2835133 RepID=A0ABS5TU10_9ACTN|nr:DUF397 domain-containing protein [Kineosporia corallincola]
MTFNRDPQRWVKASRSAGDNACVEQRRTPRAVEVRDTKQHGAGPTLGMTPTAFADWLSAAKAGELDTLLG